MKGYQPLSPPLGLGYIAHVMSKHNIDVQLVDLYATPHTEAEITDIVARHTPRVVGCHCYSESSSNAVRICRLVKQIDPTIMTVLGGPHATFAYQELLGDCSVDVVVLCEGEHTMLDIWGVACARPVRFDHVPGIA